MRPGLLPLEGGGRYLMLSKDTCKVVGIALGQELEITIGPDSTPGHAVLSDELAEALAAWSEAEVAFNQYTAAPWPAWWTRPGSPKPTSAAP